MTYTNGSLTDESAGSWSTWSSYSGRISSGTGFSVSGTSVTAGANSSTSSREGNLELTQTQTSDYSGSTSSYKSDSANINVPLEQMGADIKSVNFIHLSYSWQSKDGAYDIYSVYASASYKVGGMQAHLRFLPRGGCGELRFHDILRKYDIVSPEMLYFRRGLSGCGIRNRQCQAFRG